MDLNNLKSTKNYTLKKRKTRNKKMDNQNPGQMTKQSCTDKITQRSIHIHSDKKRKRKKYIYKMKRATKSIIKSINHNKL